MDWKHLLAYITGTVDQELLLRNEYLVTENRPRMSEAVTSGNVAVAARHHPPAGSQTTRVGSSHSVPPADLTSSHELPLSSHYVARAHKQRCQAHAECP
jgi:hypothetical protein